MFLIMSRVLSRATVLPVSHIAASQSPYSKLTQCMRTCLSAIPGEPPAFTFLVQLDQRNRNSSGIRMGIVRSSSAGHCAELTAKPAEAKRSPLPGGSPIKMCRNVKRKVTELNLLRSLLHRGVPATTGWHKVKTVWGTPPKKAPTKNYDT